MTYTYCEIAMWHIMMPAAFRYLSETEPDWDIPALKRRSKQIYRQIVSRTHDIGSMMKNPLRVCMTGGMLWLSVFEAADGRMSEERFEGMVNASAKKEREEIKEKESKPTRQAEAGIHGQEDKSGFRLSRLIQFGE